MLWNAQHCLLLCCLKVGLPAPKGHQRPKAKEMPHDPPRPRPTMWLAMRTLRSLSWSSHLLFLASWNRVGITLAPNNWSLFCGAYAARIRSFIPSHWLPVWLTCFSSTCFLSIHVSRRNYASLRVATRRYVLWHLPPGVAGKDTKVAQHGLARCGRGDTVRHLVCKTWSDTWWNAWAAWRFTWLCGKLRCLLQCRRHPTVTCNSCNVITFTQTKKIRSTPLAVFSLQPLLKKIDRIR